MTRMTSKGQVTIPKSIRDKLGLEPGDEVGFREEGGQMIIVAETKETPEEAALRLVRHLQQMGKKAKKTAMTSEELMELTRGPFNDFDSH
jgi:AbrB family looped-hinge helix DNA binding protein